MKSFVSRPRLLVGLAAAATLGCAGLAEAQNFQGSFDEGSFGGGGAQTPPPVSAPPSGGGDFGGSFGDGSGGGGAVSGGGGVTQAPPPVTQGPTPGGGDFGSGGSFEPPSGGGSVTPAKPDQTPPPRYQPPTQQVDPQLTAYETRDFGVPPTNQLRQGQLHAPTPSSVPGGNIVTTAELAQAMTSGTQLILIDALGDQYTLPGAIKAPALASPGNYNDGVQQQAAQWLGQLTQGNRSFPIVIYCSDPYCWLSYNAVLRTVAAGYSNVYWYRGGLQAWQMAGLQLVVGGF